MTARNQSLDVLRGVAVLMVLLHHCSAHFWFGWIGVDLFFVLSGFLISGLLFSEFQRTGTIRLRRFWFRRGMKIYPGFYAMVGVAFLVFAVTHSHPPSGGRFFSDLFFLQNYIPAAMGHGWSLAVEEHFYFLLPLLLVTCIAVGRSANPFRAVPIISIACFAGCLYLRVRVSPQVFDHVAHPTHLRIDSLFIGVSLGYFAGFDKKSFANSFRWWLVPLGLIFVVSGIFLPLAIGLSFISLGFAPIVALAAVRPRVPAVFRPLAWIGVYSYSIYLWHFLVAIATAHFLGNVWFKNEVFVSSAIAIGVILSILIEMPVLKLRERWFRQAGGYSLSMSMVSQERVAKDNIQVSVCRLT